MIIFAISLLAYYNDTNRDEANLEILRTLPLLYDWYENNVKVHILARNIRDFWAISY